LLMWRCAVGGWSVRVAATRRAGGTTPRRSRPRGEGRTWAPWRVTIRSRLRRLRCPDYGVVVEAVPFARHAARCTRDVDDLVAWLATKMDKTA
jgi:hypothetical protein